MLRASLMRAGRVGCSAALIVLGGAAASAATPVKLQRVEAACGTTKLYQRCELTAYVSGTITNPYDPDEILVAATFKPPQGSPVTVEGFFYQPFKHGVEQGRETVAPSGAPVWKVRFAPWQTGRWSYGITLTTRQGTHTGPGGAFLVVDSPSQGFVRADKETGTFRFDRGATFVPVGENLCWGPGTGTIQAYDAWLRDLEAQRANYIRLWMAPWGFRLETKDTRVGRYDQLRAWQLDHLLEQSEQKGLYWQLCLLNHGAFSRSQDPDWQNNPYNVALGGMCRLPNEFATSPQAKAMFRRLLRYVVARWGYSPHLASWELFNEGDFGEFRAEDLNAWLNEMSGYLRSIDPTRRMITTSFHHEMPSSVWSSPTIDTVQLHVYDQRDFAGHFGGPMIRDLERTYRKPVVIGEFGWIDDFVRKFDDIGIHLHDGLWASLMGGSAGGGMVWYWDSYVHPNGLERHFRPVEAFWRGEQVTQRLAPVPMQLSDNDLAGWGMGAGNRAYVWLKNRTHTTDAYLAYRCRMASNRLARDRGQSAPAASYPPRVVRGATATLRGLDWFSRYRVEWWDPYLGKIIERSVSRSAKGAVAINVPMVEYDLAAKLIKLQWWEQG